MKEFVLNKFRLTENLKSLKLSRRAITVSVTGARLSWEMFYRYFPFVITINFFKCKY